MVLLGIKTYPRGVEYSGNSPIRDDALGDLAHQDEEEDEGEQPAQVVAGEVQPGAVVDVHLGALAAPACGHRQGAH